MRAAWVGALVVLAAVAGCDGEIRLGSEAPGGAGGAEQGGAGGAGQGGACPQACEGIRTCVDGQCRCPAPTQDCGGTCVDTTRDPVNCGGCGKQCQETQGCVSGSCGCSPGSTVCELGEETCIDLGSNPERCGSCSSSGCERHEVCVAGSCAKACPSGQTRCEDEEHARCAELSSDRENCGECGRSCNLGEVCAAGLCRKSKPASPCVSCPCPGCQALLDGEPSACCGGPAGVLCVVGSACP